MAPFFNEIVIKSLRNAANTPVGDAQHSFTGCTWSGHSHNVPVHRIQHFNLNPTSLPKATLQLTNTSIQPIFLALADENVSLHKTSSLSLSLLGAHRADSGQGSSPAELMVTAQEPSAVHHSTHWSSCALKWSHKHQIIKCSRWPDSGLKQVQSFKTWDNFIFC